MELGALLKQQSGNWNGSDGISTVWMISGHTAKVPERYLNIKNSVWIGRRVGKGMRALKLRDEL